MPVEIVPDADALEFAERAREENDHRWVPITAAFALELLEEGDAVRIELGVHAIPLTRRWDENSYCHCALPADKHRWRSHGLLRIMTITEFTEWHDQWRREAPRDPLPKTTDLGHPEQREGTSTHQPANPQPATSRKMFVPTMSIPEAIAEAKADLPSVQNKMLGLIKEQERRHRKQRRSGDQRTTMDYLSRRNNHWLYVLTTNKKHSVQNFLMWFHAKEGLFGLQLSSQGLHYLYTPHFFTRYRERSGFGAPAAIENPTTYFYRNPNATAMRTGKEHLGLPAIIGAVPDGYVLGTIHQAEGYQRCRTFVSHKEAFPNQQEDWEGLAALQELQFRYPALFRQIKSTPY